MKRWFICGIVVSLAYLCMVTVRDALRESHHSIAVIVFVLTAVIAGAALGITFHLQRRAAK